VRLITRGGYNWTDRYPWIVEAAFKNRRKRFVIDGEAVILGVDGISDFNALHSGRHNEEVQLRKTDRARFPKWVTCGRRLGKNFLTACSVGRGVSGLLRRVWPLAVMLCAERIPIESRE
jgi:hypothetical protein